MKLLKNIFIDIAVVVLLMLINLLVTSITKITLSDILFWEFALGLLAAAATMGLSRREIRKTSKKLSKEQKERARQVFRTSEKLSFNIMFVTIILFSLSLYLATK